MKHFTVVSVCFLLLVGTQAVKLLEKPKAHEGLVQANATIDSTDSQISWLRKIVELQNQQISDLNSKFEKLQHVCDMPGRPLALTVEASASHNLKMTTAMIVANQISKQNADARIALKNNLYASMAQGVSDFALVLIRGGSPQEMAVSAGQSAIGVAVAGLAVLGFANPLIGVVAGFFSSLIGSLWGGQGDKMQQMVQEMILQNNIQQQMKANKQDMEALGEETEWMDEVLSTYDSTTGVDKSLKLSWLFTVQLHMAKLYRRVFDACIDDAEGDLCKRWQEAGTVQLAVPFVQLHELVLTDIYRYDTDLAEVVKLKLADSLERYVGPLEASYNTYNSHRQVTESGNTGKFYNYKCKDAGITVSIDRDGTETAQCQRRRDEVNRMKNQVSQAINQIKSTKQELAGAGYSR